MDKARGAACQTIDKRAGHCIEIDFPRINYGPKGPSGTRNEKVLVCEAPPRPAAPGADAGPAPRAAPGAEGDELPVPGGWWGAAGGVAVSGTLAAVALVVVRRRRRG